MPLANITVLALAVSGGVRSRRRSAAATAACPDGMAPIQAGKSWDGNLNAGTSGPTVVLCAGRQRRRQQGAAATSADTAGPITSVVAVGAQTAAQASACPPGGFTPVGKAWKSQRGYTALCFSRNSSLGLAFNTLEGRVASAGSCPSPLTVVTGHFFGPPPPPVPIPNATVCHGFTCTVQDQLCPDGTPGATDRDYRCCACKAAPKFKCTCRDPLCWLEGDAPGAAAPQCPGGGAPPIATRCPGYICTPAQQGQLCRKGTPGASDRDFRCCADRWVSGPTAGSPAPNCTSSAFAFGR
jgi:hypothetical protein